MAALRFLALITLPALALVWASHRPHSVPDPSALARWRAALAQRLVRAFDAEALRRDDGCTYGIDLFALLEHAAWAGDAALYERVRQRAVDRFLLDRPDDPYTAGFVAWRRCGDAPADASGTTEALRLARALWVGAEQLGRPADAALARRITAAYGRHATVEGGTWYVRNYFNLGTRAFANDAYLVDYDPDLLAALGFPELARRSLALVRSAATPAGLIHTLVQPDVRTVMPDLPLVVFSPNDVVQLNNACTVALTVTGSAPTLGRALLARVGGWRRPPRYLRGRDGQAVGAARADVSTLACLARLAHRLGAHRARDLWLGGLAEAWPALLADPARRRFTVAESLGLLDELSRESAGPGSSAGPPAR